MDAALGKLAERLNKGAVSVGFLENATYPDGTQVALVAAVQNFGAPSRGIPPRPFMDELIAEKKATWPKLTADLLRASGLNTERTLNRLGAVVKGQLQEKITTFEGAPLAPATIAAKGHEKQLVDTGHMLRSVDYEVKEG